MTVTDIGQSPVIDRGGVLTQVDGAADKDSLACESRSVGDLQPRGEF